MNLDAVSLVYQFRLLMSVKSSDCYNPFRRYSWNLLSLYLGSSCGLFGTMSIRSSFAGWGGTYEPGCRFCSVDTVATSFQAVIVNKIAPPQSS